jgi:enamine deaminase RidA (YjgF/YER057c/UK114 family)
MITETTPIDTGIARHIGSYSDAVRVPAGYEQIFVSGTPGLRADGTLPEDFREEATQAWRNVEEALHRAGAQLSDIVSVRQWLTDADDLPTYVAVRKEVIRHKPAFMLGIIPGLVWPQLRLEIEVTAALPGKRVAPTV